MTSYVFNYKKNPYYNDSYCRVSPLKMEKYIQYIIYLWKTKVMITESLI